MPLHYATPPTIALCTGERFRSPVVVLVMEGDYDTLKTAYDAVEADIPVLVFDGSGKAADFIAAAYNSEQR